MEKILRDNLLAIAAAYSKATGASLAAISKKFYGNRTFFRDLKSGKQPYSVAIRKAEKIVNAFREAWPDGTPWPPTRMIGMGRHPQE